MGQWLILRLIITLYSYSTAPHKWSNIWGAAWCPLGHNAEGTYTGLLLTSSSATRRSLASVRDFQSPTKRALIVWGTNNPGMIDFGVQKLTANQVQPRATVPWLGGPKCSPQPENKWIPIYPSGRVKGNLQNIFSARQKILRCKGSLILQQAIKKIMIK